MDFTLIVVLWAIVIVGCLIIEGATVNLVTLWFALAAVPSLIMALLGVSVVIQVIVFVILSTLLLLITKPFVNKLQRGKTIKTNYESIVNKKGVALEDFGTLKDGYVKVEGMEWLASSEETVTEGSTIRVKSVSGSRLKVENID